MTKLTDAMLAKALQAKLSPGEPFEEHSPSFTHLRLQARNSAVNDIVNRLDRLTKADFNDPSDPRIWMQLSIELREQKMPASAKELWKHGMSLLPSAPFKEWIHAVPTSDLIEPIRKKLATPVADFMDQLLNLGDELYATAGAEWMLQRGNSDTIGPLLDAMLDQKPRPRGLTEPSKLLTDYLTKDPKGLRLLNAVHRAQAIERRLHVLAEAASPQIAVHAGKLSRELPSATTKLIELMYSGRNDSVKALRRAAVNLAAIGTSILKIEPVPPEVTPCLDILAKLAAEIRVASASRKDAEAIWTFEPVAGRSGPQRGLTLEGARQWALVFERARIDNHDLGYLESFASNVGLQELASPGETTNFRPNIHEDASGGLLAGDQVEVISSGWHLDGVTVVKAIVRAMNNKE